MKNKKILIITADYYSKISNNLRKEAVNILNKKKAIVNLQEVPGVFEIPVVISKYIRQYDGFVALGCVIKGKTPHFDFICKTTFDYIMHLSINSKKPVGNGIITALNMKQAIIRSKKKGLEASAAVISILSN
jgi:6,7-dimethyl-8-ribityllumazine synthase